MTFDPFRRLWVRLLLATLVPVAVAFISVGVLANYVAVARFDAFFQRDIQQRDARLVGAFSHEYLFEHNWANAGDAVQRFALLTGERLVLVDAKGAVLADSASGRIGQQAAANWHRPEPIWVGSQQVGTLYVNPTLPSGTESQQEGRVLANVNRSLLLGLLVAAAVSLLVSFVAARTIGRQMASLIDVARQIGKGDLSPRARTVSGELGELAVAINGMAADLQRGLRLRQQMVADVAHELRNPLQNINGYLEALKDGVTAADEHTLNILSSESNVLRQLVDDLQDLSLAESGAMAIELEPVRVEEQVGAVVSSMQPRADERRVALSNDLPPELPPVRADARRLRQVISNLVSNALKYTQSGGRVWLTAAVENGHVELIVADNGSGVGQRDQERIFERFYRVDPARARATGGAGLGLTIAKELVQAMHGSIGVRSQPVHGSEFWVRLPLAQAAAVSAPVAPHA
ncbi:MAG: sensor histidine kinase [Chloroflexota bacterium]